MGTYANAPLGLSSILNRKPNASQFYSQEVINSDPSLATLYIDPANPLTGIPTATTPIQKNVYDLLRESMNNPQGLYDQFHNYILRPEYSQETKDTMLARLANMGGQDLIDAYNNNSIQSQAPMVAPQGGGGVTTMDFNNVPAGMKVTPFGFVPQLSSSLAMGNQQGQQTRNAMPQRPAPMGLSSVMGSRRPTA